MTLLVLAGCSSVPVTPPQPPPDAERACRDLSAALPTTVAGQGPRDLEPASDYTAGWGDPPVVLRCGVPRPAALTATSQLISVNGVDWFAEELTAGYVFTTYGRAAYVEITVPDDFSPEVGPVTELSSVIDQTVPRRPRDG